MIPFRHFSMNKTSLGVEIAEELSRIVSKGRNSWDCHRSLRFTVLIFIVINWTAYFISRYDILWDIELELYLSIYLLPSWRMIRYCCCNFRCSYSSTILVLLLQVFFFVSLFIMWFFWFYWSFCCCRHHRPCA